jgi:pilus assembly protein TadC
MLKTAIIVVLWLAGVTLLYFLFTGRRAARVARDRMISTHGEDLADREPDPREPALSAWLTQAGFRAVGSASAFVLATLLSALLGAGLGLLLALTPLLDPLRQGAADFPAGVGSIALTVLSALPWVVFIFVAAAPWLYVRKKRRERVDSIERELPIVLELLATLSESGLGFDASFSKILDSERQETPLIEEFRIFQLETLAGIARVRCFRRLTRRCEVSSMTIFCSALIQAEQIGAGFSNVLRTQATDLRNRRRDRAMIKAQALPVKLVFPLVICFLPGIFVVTLGPAFREFFEMAQGVISGGR